MPRSRRTSVAGIGAECSASGSGVMGGDGVVQADPLTTTGAVSVGIETFAGPVSVAAPLPPIKPAELILPEMADNDDDDTVSED